LDLETDRSLVEDARRLLGECWLFRDLGPDERNALFARVRIRVRSFAAGETIFLKGSPGDHMMAVLRGTVRISVASADGQALVLAILLPGELFGEIALLDGKDRTADATAVTECSLATLDRSEILSFLQRYPGAWPHIVAVLCDRLRKTDAHLADLAQPQLPVRLAKVLLRVAANDLHAKPGQNTFPIQPSQRELGNMVGAARESVDECLRSWQSDGIIVIEAGLITIIDRKSLEELAIQKSGLSAVGILASLSE
jgi:CRP/FNR family transcriptional regulator, cyclic AMP receptor protein